MSLVQRASGLYVPEPVHIWTPSKTIEPARRMPDRRWDRMGWPVDQWQAAAITQVAGATVTAGSSAGSGFTSGPIDSTGCDFIAVVASYYNNGGTRSITLADSKSNVYVPRTAKVANDVTCLIYYVLVPTVGSGHTFSVTTVVGTTFCSISVAGFSGVKTATAYDTESAGASTAGATSLSPGALTPSEGNCLVIGGIAVDGGTSFLCSGFTVLGIDHVGGAHEGGALAYLIQTTAASANAPFAWTTSGPACAVQASFKSADGGGASNTAIARSYPRGVERGVLRGVV